MSLVSVSLSLCKGRDVCSGPYSWVFEYGGVRSTLQWCIYMCVHVYCIIGKKNPAYVTVTTVYTRVQDKFMCNLPLMQDPFIFLTLPRLNFFEIFYNDHYLHIILNEERLHHAWSGPSIRCMCIQYTVHLKRFCLLVDHYRSCTHRIQHCHACLDAGDVTVRECVVFRLCA